MVTGAVAETEVEAQKQAMRGAHRLLEKKAPRKPIPNKVQNVLWGRASGRCQYAGCNRLLIGKQISGARNANESYIATSWATLPMDRAATRSSCPSSLTIRTT